MQALTRTSFIKALIATTALPQVAVGANSESDKPIQSPKEGINSVDAAAIMDKYGLIPVKGKPGTFDFFIGKKQYRYGFISNIHLWGIAFPTREKHRAIISLPVYTLQAVRVEGEWNYPTGSAFPRDFLLKEFADEVDCLC